jgi:hypothetical protein
MRLDGALVDLFEILSAIQMQPGHFGTGPPPAASAGQVWFENQTMQQRIDAVLVNCNVPEEFSVVFTGNVELYETVYSPGESAMTAVQDAVDAEFPGVGNVYVDRFGRLAAHGRLSRFDPAGTAASSPWDYHHWQAGDGATVNAHPGTYAQIRRFSFNRGLSKVINQALATPAGIADTDMTGTEITRPHGLMQTRQLIYDPDSIAKYGIRSWSAQSLQTKHGADPDDGGALTIDARVETQKFSAYYVANFAQPLERITDIAFRSLRPTDARAGATWRLLSEVDVGDTIEVTVGAPGGGGFSARPYFVEGVHEQVQPLNANYDDVTLTLDLSPQAYFNVNPWVS